MSETSPRVAFIAAALVLLVMPMIFVVGLIGLPLIAGGTAWTEMDAQASVPMLTLTITWGMLVMLGVLMVVRRLIRRSARS